MNTCIRNKALQTCSIIVFEFWAFPIRQKTMKAGSLAILSVRTRSRHLSCHKVRIGMLGTARFQQEVLTHFVSL